MSESANSVSKPTLFISIGVSLLIGFLSGIIYSDRAMVPGSQTNIQQELPQQPAYNQDQKAEQIASYELAAQQNPNNAEAWTQLGHIYFDTNQPAKAIEAYNKSLAIIPGNAPVIVDLGVMYRRNSQPKKAIEMFDKALKARPGFEQALFNKGIVFLHDLNDPQGAIEAWNELLLVNPSAIGPKNIPVAKMVESLEKETSMK